MSAILNCVNSYSPLSEDASADLLQCIRSNTYQKGEKIHSDGKVCRKLFFVESGLQ